MTRMARSAGVLVLIGVITVAATVLILTRRHTESTPNVGPSTGVVQGEIVPFEKSGLSADTLKSSNYRVVDGIRTALPGGYREGMMLVEISFLKRNSDESIEPLEVGSSVEIMASDKTDGPWIGVGGAHTLRMAVTTNEDGLVPGRMYRVGGYFIAGNSTLIKTAPLNPVFWVPLDLPPSSVYRVKLIIKDEIVERQVLARRKRTL